MCGIIGYYSKERKFNSNDLISMSSVIGHRGPDAEGFFNDDVVGLGHRRLSIIDLSESANQPMYSDDSRYVIVYNGEVYNFKEIKKELEALGHHHYNTNSDTEIILKAFTIWQYEFVNKLNGMFAIAIYDKAEKRLNIFRDRLGIKPVFYYYNNHEFAFASELKSLLEVPYIKNNTAINNKSVDYFLHLGYIPQPGTIYYNINKFPSGHYCIIDSKGLSFTKYWSATDKIAKKTIDNEEEAFEKLNNLLTDSVEKRLFCDVPFGVFLSGGIDSSLVAAIAAKVSPTRINSFSIGFKEDMYNESIYAKRVAAYINTNHYEFFVTEKDALDLLPSIIDTYDEPYADTSALPTLLISKLAKAQVTMVLSGDGGDELFMGYGAYRWAERLNNPFINAFHKPLSLGLSLMGSRYKRIGKMLCYNEKDDIRSHIFSQEQYLFSQYEIKNLVTDNFPYYVFSPDKAFDKTSRKLSAKEKQAIFDINYYLKDDLLVKVDRASMQHSLEVRVPILDYRIVELSLNLNQNLKIKDDIQKYLLKKVLYSYIPSSYFDRPKWGFSIPLKQWMKKDLKSYVNDYLSADVINRYGIVKAKEVQKMLKLFEKPQYEYLYNRIWALAVLHQFFEKNCKNN